MKDGNRSLWQFQEVGVQYTYTTITSLTMVFSFEGEIQRGNILKVTEKPSK